MSDVRRIISKAMSAAGEMRLALSGHVSFEVAARKWDEASQEAYEAVCNLVEPQNEAQHRAELEAVREACAASCEEWQAFTKYAQEPIAKEMADEIRALDIDEILKEARK